MPGLIEALLPRVEASLRDVSRRVDDAGRALVGVGAAARPGLDPQRLVEDDHYKGEELVARAQSTTDRIFAFASAPSGHPLLPLPPLGLPRAIPMPAQLVGFARVLWSAPLEKRPREPVLFIEPAPLGAGERTQHLRAFNRATMALVLTHDLLGHFLLGIRRRQAPTLMQRVSASVLLDEGFAHYVEQLLLEDPTFGADPKLRFVVERTAQLRLLRLLASLRFHAQAARLDDITRMFSEEGALDDYQARKEAERVALDPMAGAEALGRLEIERLRNDWQAVHVGEHLGKFHQALLSHGGTPIELLREELLAPR